jgi:hypothetical protein
VYSARFRSFPHTDLPPDLRYPAQWLHLQFLIFQRQRIHFLFRASKHREHTLTFSLSSQFIVSYTHTGLVLVGSRQRNNRSFLHTDLPPDLRYPVTLATSPVALTTILELSTPLPQAHLLIVRLPSISPTPFAIASSSSPDREAPVDLLDTNSFPPLPPATTLRTARPSPFDKATSAPLKDSP